jgi:hypothetical protein
MESLHFFNQQQSVTSSSDVLVRHIIESLCQVDTSDIATAWLGADQLQCRRSARKAFAALLAQADAGCFAHVGEAERLFGVVLLNRVMLGAKGGLGSFIHSGVIRRL